MTDLVFIAVALCAVSFFYFATGRDLKVLIVMTLWAAAVGIAAWTGVFADVRSGLPRLMLGVNLPAILYVIVLYRRQDVRKINTSWLLAIHTLRVPVEIVLYSLYVAGEIPRLMTFNGWNFDMLTGLSAAMLLIFQLATGIRAGRRLMFIWNIAGLFFLAAIVCMAILSAPSPIQQLGFEQPNRAVTRFPYTILPGVVVPLVLLSHLLGLKTLKTYSPE